MKIFLRWCAVPFAYLLGAIIANIFLTCLFRYTFLWGIFLEIKHDFVITGGIFRHILGYFVLIIWSAVTSGGSLYCSMSVAPKYQKQTGLVIATILSTICIISIFLGIGTSTHIVSSVVAIITSFATTSLFNEENNETLQKR